MAPADGAATAGRRPALPVLLLLAMPAGLWLALIALLDGLPYQDVPNHLARAVAIADLVFDGGRRFGGVFTFEWQAVPYILGDAFHVATLRVLAPDVAARVWTALAFAALPAGAWALCRAWRLPPAATVAIVLFGAFLSADWFLGLGFLSFRYGVGAALVALALRERALERGGWRWVAFGAAVAACYLVHLSSLLFMVAAGGAIALARALPRRRLPWAEALSVALPLALLAWHVAFRGGSELGVAMHPAPLVKLLRVVATLAYLKEPPQVAVALAFFAVLAGALLLARGRRPPGRAVEAGAAAAALFALYFVLPEQSGDVWGIDVRALPLAWFFATAAAVLAADAGRGAAPRLAVAASALTLAGLLVALPYLRAGNDAMKAYREVAAAVPPGERVLPIATAPQTGWVRATGHAGSFATVDAGAVVPYTFTGDQGAPMPYFRFVRAPAAPWPWWYTNHTPPRSWDRLLAPYDWFLVQLPVDADRLPLPLEAVRSGEGVVLARRARRVATAGPGEGRSAGPERAWSADRSLEGGRPP